MRLALLSLTLLLALSTASAGFSFETSDTVSTPSPVRLRAPIDTWVDVDDLTQAQRDSYPPLPEDARGIGPGSPLLITIPGEGTFICTANFVFTAGTKTYLGAAGHCFLPESKTATHGPGADYNAAGVVTEVCIDFCLFGGQATGLLGDFVTLGAVAYARQTAASGDIGNDFGIVEIPSNRLGLVRSELPMFEGPTGADSFENTGKLVAHYGNGIDAGTFYATKGRVGTTLNDGIAASWQASIEINGGDSGSPIVFATAEATSDVVVGEKALGIITHGLVTGVVPLGWGTTIGQAISMASQASLTLTLVLE